MGDAFLIIVLAVCSAVVLTACIIFLAKFGHPDDKNSARFPKLVTVSGLFIAVSTVLMLPFDVANVYHSLPVDIIWQVLYISIAVYCFALIPFAFFYYESDQDPEEKGGFCKSQFGEALKYSLLFAVIFIIIVVIMYSFLGTARLNVSRIIQSPDCVTTLGRGGYQPDRYPWSGGNITITASTFVWDVVVTVPVYITAVISFIGWWFFTVFVAVGLAALPMDLINEFRTRPVPMKTQEWIEEKKELGLRSVELARVGEALVAQCEQGPKGFVQKRKHKQQMKAFEQHFYFLKNDYEVLNVAYHLKGGNPVWYFVKLVLGILAGSVSVAWYLHIFLNMLWKKPIHPFLNDFFMALSSAFDFFGIVAYGIWSIYLLWCCVWGNLKLGLRFLFFRIYPMEINKT